MLINTKHFGQIDITEDKIVEFEAGLFGFEELKQYTIIHDVEDVEEGAVFWLQSIEEPSLALPMINPLVVKKDYQPSVNEGTLKSLGNLTKDNIVMYLVMTVPADLTKMTANLKAPIVINMDSRKGVQAVADNADYIVKYNVYDLFSGIESEGK